ncbi:mannosyltransferase [Linderina pennispora]|nr:mannosyltransferase [Linderina pennispora]
MWAAYYLVLRATAVGTGPMVERLFTSHRLLLYRIMPFFVVLLVFSVQRHKEERFLSIAYPHMCFNAAVCLSLLHPLRAWLQARTGRAWSARSDSLNLSVLAVAGVIGLLRMGALYQYYGGYSSVFLALPGHSASNGLLPLGPTIKTLWGSRTVRAEPGRQRTVCMGKEWYRFPSSYWLPEGFRLEFVPSQFSGHLPGSFNESATGAERSDFNDMNRWEPRHVVDEAVCDYAVDTEFGAAAYAENEVPFARRSGWQKRMCEPVLDPQRTRLWERVVYVPGGSQRWGEVCIFERDQSSGDPGMV